VSILLVGITIFASFIIYSPRSYAISLAISHVDDAIQIILKNDSSNDLNVALPLVFTVSDSLAGIEYFVTRDGDESQKFPCGLVNQLSVPEKHVLKAGGSIESAEKVKFISDIFCLSDGDYKIKAIYHNKINGVDISPPVVSNDLFIHINRGAK
jgi:hypothetical protein